MASHTVIDLLSYFSILKEIAKSNIILFAIASEIEKERQLIVGRVIKEKSKEIIPQK